MNPLLAAILRFELRQQLKTPLFWVGCVAIGMLGFGAVASDAVQLSGGVGSVFRNAPSVIATISLILCMVGMMVVTSFVSSSLLKDFEHGTSEILFSTPISRCQYVLGRFAAAYLASTFFFVVVLAGVWIGTHMPWLDPELLGPSSIKPYLWSLVVLVMPNVLFMGAILALLAVTTRSILMVYAGFLGVLVLWGISGRLLSDISNEWISCLLDPMGMRALSRSMRYWSVDERNHLLPPLDTFLLWNRVAWIALGVVMLGIAANRFKPQRTGTAGAILNRGKPLRLSAQNPGRIGAFRHPARSGWRTSFAMFYSQVRFECKGAVKSPALVVMLLFGSANLVGASSMISPIYGTDVYPETHLMAEAMRSSFSFLLIVVAAFYAGELVWRERQTGIAGVTDSMPVPGWVPVVSKLAALWLIMLLFLAAGTLVCIAVQLYKGYHEIDLGLYLRCHLVDSYPLLLMGVLAITLQVVINHNYLARLAVVLVLVIKMSLGALDLNHNLYDFGSAPEATYSVLNGFGHYWIGRLWFGIYWGLFAGMLVGIALLFRARGCDTGLRLRLHLARQRLRGPLLAFIVLCSVCFAATGFWIHHNTNRINTYQTRSVILDLKERMERDYSRFQNLPQPKITAVNSKVDINPEELSAAITGTYVLENRTTEPIAKLFVSRQPVIEVEDYSMGISTLETDDRELGVRIYRLASPLAPGGKLEFRFKHKLRYRGFTNSGSAARVNHNGTFLDSKEVFPSLGYDPGDRIQEPAERRKRSLPEIEPMPMLGNEAARARNCISRDADWIQFEATVSTSPDQIALCPGQLQREWMENGRRCFHYKCTAPILNYFAFLSARWSVSRGHWGDIPIEVYHHPTHGTNVPRMIEAVRKSLDYYSASFSPYEHQQVRILEFPRYADYAQSFPGMIPYSESMGFIADLRNGEDIDYVTYVTAHEMAHQWWAHQVIGADMEGSVMLSESLAQYSALMVMEKQYGREHMQRFLRYELDSYLRGRGTEAREERPLLRVGNQQHIYYNKGALVFYRLRDELGEDVLNRALAKFIQKNAHQRPPYTTSQELVELLRESAPADKQDVITDLLERITFHDNRITGTTVKKLDSGRYEVTLTYESSKSEADGRGKERPRPVDDWMEFGIFGRSSENSKQGGKLLHLSRRRVSEAGGSFSIVVDEVPGEVGIDPFNKLIDRVPTDNRREINE